MTRESQGPDPCRGNLRCQDFHDPFGRRAGAGGDPVTGTGTGTIAELGGVYNCCCCDPCRFVRPELITDEEDERLYCCRCGGCTPTEPPPRPFTDSDLRNIAPRRTVAKEIPPALLIHDATKTMKVK